MDRVLDCQFLRRFGVEVELNTSNGMIKNLKEDEGEYPLGADKVANIITNTLHKQAEIHGWRPTHNNECWIVKPDSSCGIEVCSPVLKGWSGLRSLLQVIEAFRDNKIKADQRCSLHVHLNISDLSKSQLASVIAYYIKCEHVLFDSLPYYRKNNRYCQFLGMTDLFSDSFTMDPDEIIGRVSSVKYYSLNAYHFMKGGGFTWRNNRKQTLEFRIGENEACLDPYLTKNWIRLLLHFVDVTKNLPLPPNARQGDQHTGLLWLDVPEVFKILHFDEAISAGLRQVRAWFLNRILRNGIDNDDKDLPLIWTDKARAVARQQFMEYIHDSQLLIDYLDTKSAKDRLYGRKYVV